jgi:hypothetical protein
MGEAWSNEDEAYAGGALALALSSPEPSLKAPSSVSPPLDARLAARLVRRAATAAASSESEVVLAYAR